MKKKYYIPDYRLSTDAMHDTKMKKQSSTAEWLILIALIIAVFVLKK